MHRLGGGVPRFSPLPAAPGPQRAQTGMVAEVAHVCSPRRRTRKNGENGENMRFFTPPFVILPAVDARSGSPPLPHPTHSAAPALRPLLCPVLSPRQRTARTRRSLRAFFYFLHAPTFFFSLSLTLFPSLISARRRMSRRSKSVTLTTQ